jgi:hypothetical protein
VCGRRSGAAVHKDAELVPLGVGKDHPAHLALADVGGSSTQVEQTTDLVVLLPVGWVEVEVSRFLTVLPSGTRANVNLGGPGPGWCLPSGTSGAPMVTLPSSSSCTW